MDAYFAVFRGNYSRASLALGLATYLLGLVTAWAIHFGPEYARSAPIYVGVPGIIWTGSFVGWGRKRICELLVEIESAFQPSKQQYADQAGKWLRRLFDWRPQIAASLLTFLASSAFVWYATSVEQFPWFPRSWSEPGSDLWVRNA